MKTRKKEKLPGYFQEVLQKILSTRFLNLIRGSGFGLSHSTVWINAFGSPPKLSRFNCCMFYFEKLPLDNPGFIPFDLTEACVRVCLRERVCTCERVCLCVCVRKVPAGEWRVE